MHNYKTNLLLDGSDLFVKVVNEPVRQITLKKCRERCYTFENNRLLSFDRSLSVFRT